MKSDCGHPCCEIRDNDYHSHTSDPDDCELCLAVLVFLLGKHTEYDDVA